jgi:hypothetical protein
MKRKKHKIITITDWDYLESDGTFIIGGVYEYDITIELSPLALTKLLGSAKRQGIVVLESQGFKRVRGSLERI